MSEFKSVITGKISELFDKKEDLRKALLNPAFHSFKVQQAINDVIPQIDDFEGEIDDLRKEVCGLLQSLPMYVESVWNDCSNGIKEIDSDMVRWTDMLELYNQWCKDQKTEEEKEEEAKAIKSLDEDNKAKIESGEIKEPSKMTGMKRKVGKRPPITLSKYRSALDDSGSGEDSEA